MSNLSSLFSFRSGSTAPTRSKVPTYRERIATAPGQGPEPGTFEVNLSRSGITWTLSGVVDYGLYINGDPWVLPATGKGITVRSVSPGPVLVGPRWMNGSMLNPRVDEPGGQSAGFAQAYDNTMYAQYRAPGDFQLGLMKGPGPFTLQAGDSLVSTVSHPSASMRPQLKSAAVLTVVAEKPNADELRPSYVAGDKDRFSVAGVDYGALRLLPDPAPTRPGFPYVASWFDGVRLNHTPQWLQRFQHPSEIMPDYGQRISEQTGTAALMLLLDVPDEEKRNLLVRYLQLGVDLFGVAKAVRAVTTSEGQPPLIARARNQFQTFQAYGGHHNGNKSPILFAGLVLGVQEMVDICRPDSAVAFSEDDQTFIVDELRPEQGYDQAEQGLVEWGERHFSDPSLDISRWQALPQEQHDQLTGIAKARNQSVKYRRCCTANTFWGHALAFAALEGGREAWGHEPFFQYMARYRATEPSYSTGFELCAVDYTNQWPLFMWDQHAASLGL